MKWIVVANRAGAKVYLQTTQGDLVLQKNFPNPSGRLRNSQLLADKPGQSRAKFKGASPHNLTGEKNPHEEVATQFVKDLSNHLIKDLNRNHDLNLTVVMEAKLLGKFRSYFDKDKLKRIQWIEKDLGTVPQQQWHKILGIKKNRERYHRIIGF